MNSFEAGQEVALIVMRVNTGDLSYEDGKALAKPYLDIMNKKGAEIALKHGKRFKPFTWSYMLRLG